MTNEHREMKLDNTDEKLLNIIQTEVPLNREPFAVLGLRLNMSGNEIIRRIERLKEEGIIRQIGPVFNPRRLGYQTTLVAMKVATGLLDEANQIISAHPLVSHCYERNHDFNFWFTLAMPAKENLESEVQKLGSRIKNEVTLNLPAVKVFKIGAYFNLSGDKPLVPNTGIECHSSIDADSGLSTTDRAVINELQQDLPLIERPFDSMSAKLSINVGEFLSHCQTLLQRRIMQRFSASINHNKLGFTANAMACWKVPPDMVDSAGKKMATFPEVSHCYARQTSSLWPYNLFAMIHAETKKSCKAIAGKISAETRLGKNDLVLLFSTREIKKVRVRYPV
jgi:DNA-binding Lrp family transcriptional regulator